MTEDVDCDKTLDVTDKFCYLGDTLSSGGGCTSAFNNRRNVAWGKFRKLLPILTSRHLPFLVSGRLYYACARPTGSQMTWDLQRLQRNDRAMLRWIYGVKARDGVSSEDMLCALMI